MVTHTDLRTLYQLNFALAHHHKWDIQSIENLIPFERDLYVDMIIEHMKKQEEEQQNG